MNPTPSYVVELTSPARIGGRAMHKGSAIPCRSAKEAYGLHEAYGCAIVADGRKLSARAVVELRDHLREQSEATEAARVKVPVAPVDPLKPPLPVTGEARFEVPTISASVDELREWYRRFYGATSEIEQADFAELRWGMSRYFVLPAAAQVSWREVPPPPNGVREFWALDADEPETETETPAEPVATPAPPEVPVDDPFVPAVTQEPDEPETADLLELRDDDSFPPRSGPGSSKASVAAFLRSYEIEFPRDMSRDEMLDLVAASFVPTEE